MVRRSLIAVFLIVIASRVSHAQTGGRPPADDVARQALSTIDALRTRLDEERTLSSRQAERLDALAREVADLRARLASMEAPAQAVVADQSRQPLERRVEAIEQTLERLPELPARVVTAGSFPGSITVPGTDAAFKLGGQLRTTFVHTFDPLGTDDRFIASSIPVEDARPGEEARTTYTAVPSRLNFDLRSPAPFGAIRTFVEADFGGVNDTVRMRHAYLQTGHWVFGQTWSTFSDPEIEPLDIDFEGENAISRFRQAQVRYTRDVARHVGLAVALENPAPDLSNASGVNLTPDAVVRVRWEPGGSATGLLTQPTHVQAAVLVRTLRGESTVGDQLVTSSTGGVGGTVSGVLVPLWAKKDRIKFAAYGGSGVGRYITDLRAEGGQDAVYDATTDTLRALPVVAGYVGYEHRWHRAFASTFTYGVVQVENLDIQAGGALRRTQRAAASVTWNPMAQADLVFEVIGGERVNKDGARGSATQFQAGWRFRF